MIAINHTNTCKFQAQIRASHEKDLKKVNIEGHLKDTEDLQYPSGGYYKMKQEGRKFKGPVQEGGRDVIELKASQ